MKITRVYASHLWKPVLLGSSLFCLVFFGGIGLLIWQSYERPVFHRAAADSGIDISSRCGEGIYSLAGDTNPSSESSAIA
jgi:hypothetical protein